MYLISERQLTRFFPEGTKHHEFQIPWVICVRPVNPQIAPQELDHLAACMRTFVPNFVTVELSNTYAQASGRSPDVKDGFVRKPSLPFVFGVEDKVGRKRVFEGQLTRLATAIRIPHASHHVNTLAALRYWSPPWHRALARKLGLGFPE